MKLSLTSDPGTNRHFVLLAPPGLPLSGIFNNVDGAPDRRRDLLAQLQRLRGRVYLADRAITERDLTPDGRHCQPLDQKSWHLLIMDGRDRVVGCTRYRQHSPFTSFNSLRVKSSALARSGEWREPLRRAVENELETARRFGFSIVEVGGWALDDCVRGTGDAVRSVLFTFAWSQVIGGCLGLSMATHRNGSASILRRIGGSPLEWNGQTIPPYYDAQYGCDMEIIRFDSRIPSARYQQAINDIKSQIPSMPVISADKTSSAWDFVAARLENPFAGLAPWHKEGVAPAA